MLTRVNLSLLLSPQCSPMYTYRPDYPLWRFCCRCVYFCLCCLCCLCCVVYSLASKHSTPQHIHHRLLLPADIVYTGCLYGLFVWVVCMGCLYGLFVWIVCMGCLYRLFIWVVYMGFHVYCLYGLFVWVVCMGCCHHPFLTTV